MRKIQQLRRALFLVVIFLLIGLSSRVSQADDFSDAAAFVQSSNFELDELIQAASQATPPASNECKNLLNGAKENRDSTIQGQWSLASLTQFFALITAAQWECQGPWGVELWSALEQYIFNLGLLLPMSDSGQNSSEDLPKCKDFYDFSHFGGPPPLLPPFGGSGPSIAPPAGPGAPPSSGVGGTTPPDPTCEACKFGNGEWKGSTSCKKRVCQVLLPTMYATEKHYGTKCTWKGNSENTSPVRDSLDGNECILETSASGVTMGRSSDPTCQIQGGDCVKKDNPLLNPEPLSFYDPSACGACYYNHKTADGEVKTKYRCMSTKDEVIKLTFKKVSEGSCKDVPGVDGYKLTKRCDWSSSPAGGGVCSGDCSGVPLIAEKDCMPGEEEKGTCPIDPTVSGGGTTPGEMGAGETDSGHTEPEMHW